MNENVIEMLQGLDIPFAYDHFAEGESPEPPFICFLYPNSDNFGADNVVYYEISTLRIELYTDKKDPEAETKIEKMLTENEHFWEKSETWIQAERLYETMYEIQI